MYTCDDLRELLWDYLYELLEPEQAQAVRDHLAQCLACRGSLEHAEAEYHLLAHAARLEDPVPAFQVPEPEPEPVPATIPLPAPAAGTPTAGRHVAGRRLWPWAAAAAAVLLLAGGSYGLYERGAVELREAHALAQARLADSDRAKEEAVRQAEQEQAKLKTELRKSHLHVEVLGPASYQPGVACQYRVQTKDLDGNAAPAEVAVRIVDAARDQPLEQAQKVESEGDVLAQLATGTVATPPREACLQVIAQNAEDRVLLQETLRCEDPVYATHLSIDKPLYRPGEIIFFRSVTLDSFQKKPPEKPFALLYTLTDPNGKLVYQVGGPTRTGGIGGGEFALPDNSAEGEYTLQVAAAEGRFAPETRTLMVYRTQLADGLKAEKATATVKPEVEFFPEGGNLVADVPNRVYFRVRTSLNQPATLAGQIMDSKGGKVGAARTEPDAVRPARNVALGTFTFTPQKGETYKLKVASPPGMTVPLPLPAVEKKGLALSVPTGVTHEGEPIRAVLHTTGRERALIVGASWRDRLVAQEAVIVKPGKAAEVSLSPGAGVDGMLRLTVYEQDGKQLRPLAERLVYRVPAQRLVLSAEADKKLYHPGEPVNLKVRSLTEKNTPSPGWMLVSVVDKQAVAAATEPSLPAFFFLTSQLQHPEDLERADLLLNDTPQAARALDLYLGTQGWRRVVEATEQAAALAKAGDGEQRGQLGVQGGAKAPAAILKLDNAGSVHDKYAATLAAQSARLQQASAARQQELEEERGRRAAAVTATASDLNHYEKQAENYLRVGAGVAVLLLLVIGCGALLIALVRVVLGRTANTPYFATAFTALLICAIAFFALTEQSPEIVAHRDNKPANEPPAGPVVQNPPPKEAEQERKSLESLRQGRRLDDDKKLDDTNRTKVVADPGKDQVQLDEVLEKRKDAKKATEAKGSDSSDGKGHGPGKDGLGDLRREAGLELPSMAPAGVPVPPRADEADRDKPTNALQKQFATRAEEQERQRRLYGVKEIAPTTSRSAAQLERRFRDAEKWARQNNQAVIEHYYQAATAESAKTPAAPGGVKADKGEGKPADLRDTQLADVFLPAQTYAYVYPKQFAAHVGDFQETVLWYPILEVGASGTAQLPPFELSDSAASFRVLIYGHSPSGRLGVFNGTLEAQPRR
jgi:hypothetical protein